MIRALGAASRDVREHGLLRPPRALRDAHYPGARKLGHGEGYRYPHDDPRGFDLSYLPEPLQGRRYYEPTGIGADVERPRGPGSRSADRDADSSAPA